MSIISIDKLNSAEDEYLLTKFNHLVSKQEIERHKEKVKDYRKLRAQKKPPTILIQSPNHSAAFRVTSDSAQLRHKESFHFLEPATTNRLKTMDPNHPMNISEKVITTDFLTQRHERKESMNPYDLFSANTLVHKESSTLNMNEKETISAMLQSDSSKKSLNLKKQIKSVDHVNEIVTKTQNRYKLKTTTKEVKFNEKIKDFKKLDTFFNVRSLLQQINLTNTKIKTPTGPPLIMMPILEKAPNDSIVLEEDALLTEENEEFPYPIDFKYSMKRGMQILNFRRKLTEANMTEEDIDKHLQLSEHMTSYLKKDMRREFDLGFERTLLDNFEKNELIYRQSKKNRSEKYSISQEMELRHLEKLVQNKLKENVLKTQLKNGVYLEKYRNQASKVLEILKRTTKNIYSKKVLKINQTLMEKNKTIMNKHPHNRNAVTNDSNVDKASKSKTFHKRFMFLTEESNNFTEKAVKTVRNHRASASMEGLLPHLNNNTKTEGISANTEMKCNKKKRVFQKNRMESLTVQRKMEEFLKDCEQEKTRIMYENGEDLKEIENVQIYLRYLFFPNAIAPFFSLDGRPLPLF